MAFLWAKHFFGKSTQNLILPLTTPFLLFVISLPNIVFIMLDLLTFCLFFSEIHMCKGFFFNSNSENSTQHMVQLSKYLLMNE